MSKVFNMVGGGGGKDISSIVISGLRSTDAVTCTKDSMNYAATWDESDQHWEIVGLPLGTFTITATRETNTITETVLIDIVGVYELEMLIPLWLYKQGDECEDITGGWVHEKYLLPWTKNADCLYWYNSSTDAYSRLMTANSIDFTGFSNLHVVYDLYISTSNEYNSAKIYNGDPDSGAHMFLGVDRTTINDVSKHGIFSLSGVSNGPIYLVANRYTGVVSWKIKEIWLE